MSKEVAHYPSYISQGHVGVISKDCARLDFKACSESKPVSKSCRGKFTIISLF